MNGGNESSGADRAGGPGATSVPIGWQRCVREGAVLYIRYGSRNTPLPQALSLQLPAVPCPLSLSSASSSFFHLWAVCGPWALGSTFLLSAVARKVLSLVSVPQEDLLIHCPLTSGP